MSSESFVQGAPTGAGGGASAPAGTGPVEVSGGAFVSPARSFAEVMRDLLASRGLTPNLSTATITPAANCTGAGASGSFSATIDNGAVDGSVTGTLAWPIPSALSWEIKARVRLTPAGSGSTRWVDLGVRYTDGQTVVLQFDDPGGANCRARGGASQGSLASGTLTYPCHVRLLVDRGRISASVSQSSSGPWTCFAESAGLVRFSGMTPAVASLYVAANMSGVADATNLYVMDEITVTDCSVGA